MSLLYRGLVVAVCVLLLAVPSVTVAEPAVSVTQSPESVTVEPGSTVQIAVELNATGYNGPALDLTLPDGWSVVDYTTDGGAYRSTEDQWIWRTGGVKQVTYTVEVPRQTAAERTTLRMEGSALDPETDEFVTDRSQVSVVVESGTTGAGATSTESSGAGATGGGTTSAASADTTRTTAGATTVTTGTTATATRQTARTETTTAPASPTTEAASERPLTTEGDEETRASTDEATSEATPTADFGGTDTGLPGFGVSAAVCSVVALVAVLARRAR